VAAFFAAAMFPHYGEIGGAVADLVLLANVIVAWRARRPPAQPQSERDTWTGGSSA